jgi:dipeptidyl aminopeptidase/acylaminoacyl peptidase
MTKFSSKFGIFIFILTVFGISILPHASLAASTNYSSILSVYKDKLVTKYGSLETKKYYSCSISKLTCTSRKSLPTLPNVPSRITDEVKEKYAVQLEDAITMALSADGNWLAYFKSAKTDSYTARLYNFLDLSTGVNYEIKTPVGYWDLVADQPRIFQFSPDSKFAFFVDDKDNAMTLYKVDIEKMKTAGTPTAEPVFPNSKQNFSDFVILENGKLLYVANSPENPYDWSLYSYDFATATSKLIKHDIPYNVHIYLSGNYAVMRTLSSNSSVPMVYNWKTGKINYFKSMPQSKKVLPGTRSIISGTNPADGRASFHGALIKPANFDKTKTYPLLVWLHGGPYRQTSGTTTYHAYETYGIYDWMLDEAVKSGAVVLKLDYVGSLGYGKEYSSIIKNKVGDVDVASVMSAIAYVKNQNANIGDTYLAGNSYGGYLSLKTVVEHPTEIKDVFSINGVTDWGMLLVPLKNSIFNVHFNGVPDAINQNLYDQASILNKISNLGTNKIIIGQGTRDNTIDPSQAYYLNSALLNAGKNVVLVEFKGQDHSFSKKVPIQNACKTLIDLVGKSTKGLCVWE